MADANATAPEDQAPEDANDQTAQPEGDFESFFSDYASGQAEDEPPETAAEPEQTEGEGSEAQDDEPPADAGQDEPELTEREKELQAQLDRLQQSEASQRGRVGAYQRQINDLKRQIVTSQSGGSQPANQSAQQPEEGSRQEQDQQKQAMAEAVGSEDWDALKQDFPDIANALEARLDKDRQERVQLQQQVAELQSSVQPMQEQAHQQHLADQMRALEARHSDWQQVVNAPAFQQWLQQQPQWMQSQMESDNADDASALLDFYKATSQQAGSDDRAAAQQAEREKRNQRLAQSQTPQRRGAGPRQAVPDEFEAAFNHYAKKR